MSGKSGARRPPGRPIDLCVFFGVGTPLDLLYVNYIVSAGPYQEAIMKKWIIGLVCGVVGVTAAMGQSVVINEYRNATPDVIELVVVEDGLNMQGMLVKDYSSSGVNDGGGAFTFSSDSLWASVPAGTIIVLRKDDSAADTTAGGGDYNLDVGLQNTTYFTAGSGTFDIATEEIIQIKASGSDQAGSTGAIHTFATDGAGAQYDSAPTPKLKSASGDTGTGESVEAGNSTSALSDFNGTDAAGDNSTGTIGTYNNANNQTFIEGLRGPAVFSVSLDKTDGFTVEQGTQDTIIATAQNGTEPYSYEWDTDMAEGDYTASGDTFTILSTAAVGDYYATVTATDDESATDDATVNFSVIAPPDYYAITITPPVNGSVTTTPESEAAEASTVTINATPADGYAVGTITVTAADESNVPVDGTTFTMPSQDVTVTVTFVEYEGGALIISQYYEGASYDKWIEIFNPGASAVDLGSDGYYLGLWSGDNREAWKTGTAPYSSEALTGTIPAGGVYLVSHTSAALPSYALPADLQSTVCNFNGDDSVVLYTGETFAFANVTDAVGLTGNTAANKSFVRKTSVTAGVNTDFNADDWDEFSNAAVDSATPGLNEYLGYHSTGPAVFLVGLDKTSGFEVQQGMQDAITATAVNGTEPYGYTWDTDMTPGDYSTDGNVFTIQSTAALGSYSATVTATDASDPVQTVSNTVTFTVVEPLPAEGIADFRFNDAPFLQVTAKDPNISVSDMDITAGSIGTDVNIGTYFPDMPYIESSSGWAATSQAEAKAFIFTITPGEGAAVTIEGISFNAYATSAGPSAFGFDINGVATYEVDAPSASLLSVSQAVAGVVSETGAIEVKIQGWLNGSRESSGGGVFRLDDVVIHGSVSTGPLEFSVNLNQSNGFTVEQGSQGAITATAAHGTEPYGYNWDTDMTPGDYSTDGNVFTILATAALGDYSATVTATDASDPVQTASNTVTFSVVTPPPKYAITIVTNAPANGTVTTDPATEAAEGVSVTVNALAGDGFAVESILVNGGAVAVNGNAFVMPAEPVTVTVNFMVYVAPDVLIDFEDYTSITYAMHDYTTAGVTFSMTNILAGGTEGSDRFNGAKSARFHHYRTTGNAAVMSQTVPFAEAITGISFWFADYGTDSGGAFKVQVCDDGTSWQDVGEALYDPAGTTLEMAEISSIPPGMTYVQFIGVGEAAKRFNIDDIGLYFGEPVFGVSLNKSNGFEVQEGQSDAIVATAGNGTAPYTYGWDSTLGATHYTASGDTFTILATAPTGSYSATVTATDSSEPAQEAQRTVTFSVVGLPPGQPAVVFSGSLSGTVGVRLELTLGVTNTTLIEFQTVGLKDPLGVDYWEWDYSNFPPDFAFTPDQAGNWTLTAVADTSSGIITNGVTLTISEGGGDEHPPIPAITFMAGTGFSFELPAGHTVASVQGADAAVAGDAFTWTDLSSPADYEVVGSQVTIKSGAQGRRLIRVWFNIVP
jgi:hypothetical protein